MAYSECEAERVPKWSANAWLWCWQLLAVHSVSWAMVAAVAISRNNWGWLRGWMLDAFFLLGFAGETPFSIALQFAGSLSMPFPASIALPIPGAVLTVEHAAASYNTYELLRDEVLLPLALRANAGSDLELSPFLLSAMETLVR